jgi:hypothetical protein
MVLPHVSNELIAPDEGPVASSNRAMVLSLKVATHLALQLIVAIKEIVGCAARDTALQDLGRLASRWDGGNVRADDDVDGGRRSWDRIPSSSRTSRLIDLRFLHELQGLYSALKSATFPKKKLTQQ